MSILIKKSGVLSTVQDLGRTKFRRFGINPNGAMDKSAARLINILLGNDENEAVLETHFPPAQILFEQSAIVALGGANFAAQIENETIENWRPFFVEANQTLTFSEKISGNRAYLAVRGGFQTERWLDSASTNLTAQIGGFHGRQLEKGDQLFFDSKFQIPNSKSEISNLKFRYTISEKIVPHYSAFPTVRVVAGAEFECLTALSEQNFLKKSFTVSRDSNRMGFRLNGEPLCLLDKIEMVSAAVDFGAIQLLPDGQLIVLMADAQTSGGYPRLAHVVSTDLPVLAQLGAGDRVAFELVSQTVAEDLILEFERDLNLLKIGVNSKNVFG